VLKPDVYVRSVHDIDLAELKRLGIDTLLVDLDNTLLSRDTSEFTPEVLEWSSTVVADGFRVCLVSNNWHERVHTAAAELGFGLVSRAVKPLPFAFLVALKRLDSSSKRAAVVGDQVFTDVLGGNLTGARTVLVQPLSTSDLPHTLFLRRLESRILRGREPITVSKDYS